MTSTKSKSDTITLAAKVPTSTTQKTKINPFYNNGFDVVNDANQQIEKGHANKDDENCNDACNNNGHADCSDKKDATERATIQATSYEAKKERETERMQASFTLGLQRQIREQRARRTMDERD